MTANRGAVKGGPQGRPAGTAAKRRPLTAPDTNTPTMVLAPSRQLGACKTTTAPRSGAQLTLYPVSADSPAPSPTRAPTLAARRTTVESLLASTSARRIPLPPSRVPRIGVSWRTRAPVLGHATVSLEGHHQARGLCQRRRCATGVKGRQQQLRYLPSDA